MRHRIDVDDLGADPHVQAEPLEEPLGRLEEQVVFVLDHSAHEIRQTTVGVGHVTGTLDHGDGGIFVQTAKARRRRHPSGDPAHDDHPLRPHGQASFMNIRWTSSSG